MALILWCSIVLVETLRKASWVFEDELVSFRSGSKEWEQDVDRIGGEVV